MEEVFELLKTENQHIRDLFKQSRALGGMTANGPVFDRIKQELDNHLHIEETIFYPACEKHIELKRATLEAYEAHTVIKELLFEIGAAGGEGARVDARLRCLMERVDAHLISEERHLLPLAQKVMRRSELATLADEISSAQRRMSPGMRAAFR